MDRWDQEPQDLVQVKRSKLKKLLAYSMVLWVVLVQVFHSGYILIV